MSDGSPPLGVAVVGAGMIGTNHAAAVLRHPRLRVAAIVDPDAGPATTLAESVAQRTGSAPPARYDSLTAALADAGVDLVAICTPSGRHADAAEQTLAAGRHVLIEKPLDVSLPRARRLAGVAAAARDRGLVAAVVSQHRFDPASVAVAGALAAGRLGRVTSAVASVPWWRGQDYYDSAQWRGTWALDGGGPVMNQGVHTVDLLLWLLGRPVEVFAYTARLAHERIEVEDVAVATIRFGSGALGVLHATTAAYPGMGVRIAVHGDRGTAVIHDDQLEYFHVAGGPDGSAPPADQAARLVPREELRGAPKPADSFVTGHLRQYRDLVEAIDGARPPGVGVDDAVAALAVIWSLYLSATLGRPVAVDEVLAGRYDDVVVATEELAVHR
ncbi:MAG: oxidoreductase [Catenulispora sp. 13_1_20CM_3_70_7]|nr:MAG: oxidoreductase [Catenulispora sp. 13_1_20CM_3_70_7]